MSRRRAILLGWINDGHVAQCGETVKNQHIARQLERNGCQVIKLDFYRWKRRPWVVAKTLGALLLYPRTPLILSSAPKNVYRFVKLHHALRSTRTVVQWVIGGNIHQLLADGTFAAAPLNSLRANVVESHEMLTSLQSQGVTNALELPNFKPIPYKPTLTAERRQGPMRFVFLSRIKPEKGVDHIMQSVDALNARGLQDHFVVDFYGRIDQDYTDKFQADVRARPNVAYRGFLDLSGREGYDTLAGYDAMLFPTHWISEGFAGIFIDAFVAGVPVIATDWAHNSHIIADGRTGIIIEPNSAEALTRAMADCIEGRTDLHAMRPLCQQRADAYDIDHVVTPTLLACLGLL